MLNENCRKGPVFIIISDLKEYHFFDKRYIAIYEKGTFSMKNRVKSTSVGQSLPI